MLNIPGLEFRAYRGEADIAGMLDVHVQCREWDSVDRYSVAYRVPNLPPEEYAKDVAQFYADGSDRNILIAEVDGSIVAHCRLEWWREWDGERAAERFAYLVRGWVAPRWRRIGIGSHLLTWGEHRAKELDCENPAPGELAANATDGEQDTVKFLTKAGYLVRFLSPELAYDDLSDLPPALTPNGFEVRQLRSSDHVTVARALIEANSPADWSAEQTEDWIGKELPGFVDFTAGCDPTISRIAWHGAEVAGLYLCRQKDDVGDVANVAVRRPFRMQGLSRSLMFHSLGAMRDAGIKRARVFTGIGSDRNAVPEGPYKMYLGFGFKLLTFHNRYRKKMSV